MANQGAYIEVCVRATIWKLNCKFSIYKEIERLDINDGLVLLGQLAVVINRKYCKYWIP
ncbi:hypothetical protein EMIT0P74_10100 [Pseudomonas sp. IT-P74]